MSDPVVSVCVPAFNAGRYIREALESVLCQLPGGSEVIVVDDGSTDETAAVAESFGPPVRLIRGRRGGTGAAFNAAVAASRAPLIASVDADDRWMPGKLAAQLAALEADPELEAVFGYSREFLSPDVPPSERSRWVFNETAIPGMSRGAMLLRRSAWERVGELPTTLRVGEFIAWYSHALDAGLRVKVLPQLVMERRIHGANTVLRERDAWSDYLHVLKARLDRRRSSPPENG